MHHEVQQIAVEYEYNRRKLIKWNQLQKINKHQQREDKWKVSCDKVKENEIRYSKIKEEKIKWDKIVITERE